ncbi:MAG: nucleotidyltransferase family protein [Thiobacillaceae bacterium]
MRCPLLIATLRDPACLATLSLADWDRLLPQARAAGLLARLAVRADDLGLTPQLPAAVQAHLTAARTLAERQRRAVVWEARKIDAALAATGLPVLLLKGAAYVLGRLPPARGRLFSNIDILVPKAGLGHAEAQLMLHGWHATHHDAYDQRYYRQWMHELPPMTHIRRGSHLDVHHNLLPETARLRTSPERVIADSTPIPGHRCLRLPRLEDLVLHSATHRFFEGEWQMGLRDLTDIDALLRLGAARPGWWDDLLARARELNLTYPLALALRYTRRLLATPVPDAVASKLGLTRLSPATLNERRHGHAALRGAPADPGSVGRQSLADIPERPEAKTVRPGRLGWLWRDALFLRGLAATHADCALPGTHLATFVLYVRAHWLRMPLHLLLPHLLYKATRSRHSQ